MAQHGTAQSDQAGPAAESRVPPGIPRDHHHDDGPCTAGSFLDRLGDQIDDRVALALDEQLGERLEEPGPAGRAVRGDGRTGLAVVCASAAMGAAVTIASPDRVLTPLITWAAITMINLAYFFRRG